MKEKKFDYLVPGYQVVIYDENVKVIDLKVNLYGTFSIERDSGEYDIHISIDSVSFDKKA